MSSGNTDGKGRTGVLEDIANAGPTGECDIDNPDWLLAGTMIVLSAEFKFLPLKGRQYHLYERGRLYLATVSPEESYAPMGEYIGSCVQRPDCLWEVTLNQLPSTGLPANARFLHGRWNDERFGYYNNVLAFHAAKRVKLLPAGTSRLLQRGQAPEE